MGDIMRTDGTPERVLMTTDLVGGVWVYALELARELGRYGIEVVLAAMGDEPTAEQRGQAAAVENVKFEWRPFRLEWMQDPWDDVGAAGEWLLELEAGHRPDIIHLNNFVHGALAWSAPVLVVGHSCVCSWFHAVRGTDPPDEWATYRAKVRNGLQGADAVKAPTRATLRDLENFYGPFSAAGVIHNARRTGFLRPRTKEPFVLTAGRLWDEAKNVNSLDAAARRIEWPVCAAGSTRNPDGGEIRFESLRLLGSLAPEDLGEWMGRASIYALPAKYEPFGLTALEAAHAGCALVLGDIPSLREVWRDAAVFVPPENSDAISRAVNALVRNPQRRNVMAGRAARRARRYTTDRMVTDYVSCYVRLTQARPRAPQRGRIRSLSTHIPLKQLQG